MAQALKPCGTLAARDRHRVRGEEVCEACRAAWNAYMKEYKAKNKKPAARRPPSPCGTVSGYVRHKRVGDPDCEPCRLVWNAYLMERKKRLAQEAVNRAKA